MPQYVSLDQQGFFKPFEMAGSSVRAALEAYQRGQQIKQHQQELDSQLQTQALQRNSMASDNEIKAMEVQKQRIQNQVVSEADPDSVAARYNATVSDTPATQGAPAASPLPKQTITPGVGGQTQQVLDKSTDGSTGKTGVGSPSNNPGNELSSAAPTPPPSADSAFANTDDVRDAFMNGRVGNLIAANGGLGLKRAPATTNPGTTSVRSAPDSAPDANAPSAPAAPASSAVPPDPKFSKAPADPNGPLNEQPVEYQAAVLQHYRDLADPKDKGLITPDFVSRAYRQHQITKMMEKLAPFATEDPRLTTVSKEFTGPLGEKIVQKASGANGMVIDPEKLPEFYRGGQEAYGKYWNEGSDFHTANVAMGQLQNNYDAAKIEASKGAGGAKTGAQDKAILTQYLATVNPKVRLNPSSQEDIASHLDSWPSDIRKKVGHVFGGNATLDQKERDELRDGAISNLRGIYTASKSAADNTANSYGAYHPAFPNMLRANAPAQPDYKTTEDMTKGGVNATGTNSPGNTVKRFSSLSEFNASGSPKGTKAMVFNPATGGYQSATMH